MFLEILTGRAMAKVRGWCPVLLVAGIAAGCSTRDGASSTRPVEASATRRALASSNGIWQNGLTTNGIWQNGIWQNGIWQNGIWQNGIWQNGIWQNGIWQNGIWQNGIAGDALRSSSYARQLLRYVYACAMPGTLDPNSGEPIYGTTLDP